jgi:Cytochrome c554 and c-prime
MTGRPPVPVRGGLLSRVLAGVVVLAVLAAGGGYWAVVQSYTTSPDETDTPDDTRKVAAPTAKPVEVGGRPLFADWPKDKPDLVIVVSGQTHGYLSPCGCSRPQFGGLERRYNLIQQLKGKGWDVIGVDVGDVAAPPGKGLNEQALKKYVYAMKSMQEMGYVAVGVGKTDFQNELLELLGRFTLNNADKRPIVLGANVVGVQRDAAGKVTKTTPRVEMFPGAPKSRPMVEDVELVTDKKVAVGITAAVGPSVAAEVQGAVPSYGFEDHTTAIKSAVKKMAAAKADPELKVLLFQGTRAEAAQVAKDFPAFQLVVCISESADSLAPLLPDRVGNTQIVTVGHKGMNVGLMGVFKTAAGLDLRYQLVPLGEEYLTPEKPQEVADNHAVLKLLEQYTSEVKQADFLGLATKKRGKHAAMVQNPNADLQYIGAQACAKCHAGEVKKWGETKHSHAYEALEKLAKRPGLRQFDPECVSCHTTGFEYESGYVSAEKTKHLMNNGCENCHGPGSGHAAKPADKDLLKALTPWKLDKNDKLPDLKFLEKMAALPELERGIWKPATDC